MLEKIRENATLLQFLPSDNFHFTRKIAKFFLLEKIRKNAILYWQHFNIFVGSIYLLCFQVKTYILGSLRRPFLIYGQTGTGKSMFTSKIAISLKNWVRNRTSNFVMLVVRFLGTTPTSSSIPTLVMSLCQQLCYNLEVRKSRISSFLLWLLYFEIRSQLKKFLRILYLWRTTLRCC